MAKRTQTFIFIRMCVLSYSWPHPLNIKPFSSSPSRPLSLCSPSFPRTSIVLSLSSFIILPHMAGNGGIDSSVMPPHTAVGFQKQRVVQHDTASAALRRSTTKAVAMLPCRLLSTRTKSRALSGGPFWQNRKQISASLVPRTGNTRVHREL